MSNTNELQSISDDDLLRRLSELFQQSRRVECELVAHIGEVDHRRLYAREACSSMFAYCTEVLHLSEHEAYLRIAVARASRKHPVVLSMLQDGRLHLSAIARLAPHLSESNCETVLARAAYKSKNEIEELIAELAPKPDVSASIRKVPTREPPAELVPERVTNLPTPVLSRTPTQSSDPVKPVPPPPPAVVTPLAPARYRVQFTASVELRDKLDRLTALMRSSVPDGDLAAILEVAVTEKIARLESKRFGKTTAPRRSLDETDTSPSSRHVPAAVRRVVRERDDDQCAFRDEQGRRCTERRGLEFHHREPFGRGGDHNPENVCLMCRAHNAYLAERDYGSEKMDRYRRRDSRVSEPAPVYLAMV